LSPAAKVKIHCSARRKTGRLHVEEGNSRLKIDVTSPEMKPYSYKMKLKLILSF